jgi:hypothetical protein
MEDKGMGEAMGKGGGGGVQHVCVFRGRECSM